MLIFYYYFFKCGTPSFSDAHPESPFWLRSWVTQNVNLIELIEVNWYIYLWIFFESILTLQQFYTSIENFSQYCSFVSLGYINIYILIGMSGIINPVRGYVEYETQIGSANKTSASKYFLEKQIWKVGLHLQENIEEHKTFQEINKAKTWEKGKMKIN